MITNPKSIARPGGRRVAALLLAISALAAVAAGCASGYGASTAPVPSATGAAVSAQTTSLGVILVDASGRTVYEFANDTNGVSACTGACATNWPPVPAPASLPTSLPGVTGQLGTITRQDGSSQLTIAGHPLYTFAGDSAPGQTNGQGKVLDGGLWTVSSAAGAPVTAAAPMAPTSAPVAPGY
jgi:predicted lipoprotein with Yx(FWY)xxD motif